MEQEQVGRSPLRGSGHSAEPEPVPVSAASAASTPNAGHTPGPWRYGHANNYDGFFVAPDVSLPTLAAVNTDGRVNVFNFPGQTEANARLIASAPELLEACEAVVNHLAIEGSSLQLLIRAAIAKATGAQS